jgi:hypothetical protein
MAMLGAACFAQYDRFVSLCQFSDVNWTRKSLRLVGLHTLDGANLAWPNSRHISKQAGNSGTRPAQYVVVKGLRKLRSSLPLPKWKQGSATLCESLKSPINYAPYNKALHWAADASVRGLQNAKCPPVTGAGEPSATNGRKWLALVLHSRRRPSARRCLLTFKDWSGD